MVGLAGGASGECAAVSLSLHVEAKPLHREARHAVGWSRCRAPLGPEPGSGARRRWAVGGGVMGRGGV